jgi:hypothetical protein
VTVTRNHNFKTQVKKKKAMVNIITQTQAVQEEAENNKRNETKEDNRLFKSNINGRGQVVAPRKLVQLTMKGARVKEGDGQVAPRKLVQLTIKGARVKEGDVIKVRKHSRMKTVPTMKGARGKQGDVVKVKSHSQKKMVSSVKSKGKGEKNKMIRGSTQDSLYKAFIVLLNQIRFNDLMEYHQRVSHK